MTFRIGEFAKFTEEKRRRNSRGPLVMVVAQVPPKELDAVGMLASLGFYTVVDGKGTMSVIESELEKLDPVSLLAMIEVGGFPSKIRFPVTLAARPNPDGSGEMQYEAHCQTAGPLRLTGVGKNETAALRSLREQLVAIIKPPGCVEICV